MSELREADLLRAAFREVHAASLHGFALLVSLGDRARAASAASSALAAGTGRAGRLRHPERAAAWLRARVVLALRHAPDGRRRGHVRSRALSGLGVVETSAAALGELTKEERIALVAGSVERFSIADVATILGRDPIVANRIHHSARQHYLDAATRLMHDLRPEAMPGGELAERVMQAADRTIGRGIGGSPA